jgi:hypothetical protein
MGGEIEKRGNRALKGIEESGINGEEVNGEE